jgi:hypothetical protein
MRELRAACAAIAARARYVQIDLAALPAYALGLPGKPPDPDPDVELRSGSAEQRAAFWLTLDAVNFGSGWFPTLNKRPGHSGYFTVAAGIRERFARDGGWSAAALSHIEAGEIAETLGQDPRHELMALFAASLRDLGRHVGDESSGRFEHLATATAGSVVALARRLGSWACFADRSRYEDIDVPFLKRAQIAAADLARAGVIKPDDLGGLTMFADNLVPHVLRLDGILRLDPGLIARIDRGELIEHASAEEVELRACALHAVELIVAARTESADAEGGPCAAERGPCAAERGPCAAERGPCAAERGPCAAEVDQLLWLRGQQPRYKAAPRHRSRCTAY